MEELESIPNLVHVWQNNDKFVAIASCLSAHRGESSVLVVCRDQLGTDELPNGLRAARVEVSDTAAVNELVGDVQKWTKEHGFQQTLKDGKPI